MDLLGHHADLLAEHRRRPQADVEISITPLIGPVEAEQQLGEGALAGAGRADHAQHLAGHDLQVDPVERRRGIVGVAVADLLEADGP